MAKRLDRLEKFLASNPQPSESQRTSQTTRETFIQPIQLPLFEKKDQESKPGA